MLDKEAKALWNIRFRKILDLEKEGFLFYRHLLKQNKDMLKGTQAELILEKIMREELKHIKIARILAQMLKAKKSPSD